MRTGEFVSMCMNDKLFCLHRLFFVQSLKSLNSFELVVWKLS